tara:strand:+ start:246 stop:1883 length:1638 start_codon:yes stop_codon:yes gene_type:complete
MAKSPTDPSPYLSKVSGVDPEVVSQDYNLFYKPDAKPMNKAVNSLIMSLSNIVPTLANYQVTEDVKTKAKDEARAVEDFEINKKSFKDLINDGKIPEGASPFYYNKMMELDLQSKARLFKRKFDNHYIDSDLAGSLNINGFSEAYEEQLKAFYKEHKLDNYDPLALNNAFFNTTSKFRNEKYQQHSAKVMEKIKGLTEKSFTHNISGLIIDGQDDKKTANEVLTDLKGLTDGLISVGTNKKRANELFIMGFNKYVSTVNDEEGFAFAQELLTELKTFKLGTGAFGGSPEGSGLIQDLEMELATKELSSLEGKKKKETVTDDIRKQNLANLYWDEAEKKGALFNVLNLSDERINATDFTAGDFRFSAEDKNYLITLHTALEKGKEVTHNDPDALDTLMRLQDDDIYAVKDTAFALLKNLKITPQTFKDFYKSANTYEFFKNNTHFVRSTVYQNYMQMFKDKNISQLPIFSAEAPAMRNLLQENLYQWYQENKSKHSGYELTKQLNLEVKAEMGDILSNSIVVQSDFDTFSKLFATYGIVIEKKEIN